MTFVLSLCLNHDICTVIVFKSWPLYCHCVLIMTFALSLCFNHVLCTVFADTRNCSVLILHEHSVTIGLTCKICNVYYFKQNKNKIRMLFVWFIWYLAVNTTRAFSTTCLSTNTMYRCILKHIHIYNTTLYVFDMF